MDPEAPDNPLEGLVSVTPSYEPDNDGEDQVDVSCALQWENREDFLTPGKLKSLGSAAAGAIGSAARLINTVYVAGALYGLSGTLSKEANDDVEYILWQKTKKGAKALISMAPDPIVSKAALAWNISGAAKRHRGVERMHRATRLYEGIKKRDGHYIAIVFALFVNKKNPSIFLQRLLSTDDKDLAIKVLMGKIASR